MALILAIRETRNWGEEPPTYTLRDVALCYDRHTGDVRGKSASVGNVAMPINWATKKKKRKKEEREKDEKHDIFDFLDFPDFLVFN